MGKKWSESRPAEKMLSGITRESEHAIMIAYGACPCEHVRIRLASETSPHPVSALRYLLLPSMSLPNASCAVIIISPLRLTLTISISICQVQSSLRA